MSWASHMYHFKDMLNKINRQVLSSGLPTLGARQHRPAEEVLDPYSVVVVLTLYSKTFLFSRLRQVRLRLSTDREGRRQVQRPQVWTSTIRMRSIQLAEISRFTMGWRQEQQISICCANHPTALEPGLRIRGRQPKIDVPRTLRGSRSRMLRIGRQICGRG